MTVKILCKTTLVALLFPVAEALGQLVSVSGIVHDAYDNPMQGVTIVVMPTNIVFTTNAAGAFRITGLQPQVYTLYFSFVGYKKQEFNVDATGYINPLNVHLKEAPSELDVVTIIGNEVAQRRKEKSLNVEIVNHEFIRKNMGGSLMQSLDRLPGINIIGIGSGQSKPLIRGLGFNRVVVVEHGVKHEGQQWGADHGLEIDQFAVHETEIVKGAASFVYGSDAIGGAIDIKSPPLPPANTIGGSVDIIGKTNNNLYGTSFNLYGRSKAMFFDTRVTYQDYGDYRVPKERVYVYDYAVELHKNQLRNSAGKETNLHLNVGYVRDSLRSVFYISNISSKSGLFANAHGLEPRGVDTKLHDKSGRDILQPRQEVNHFKVINRSAFRLGSTVLETEAGYQHNFRQEFNHYVNHGYMPPIYPDDMPVPSNLEREFQKHVYTVNARDYLWIGKHNLTLGLTGEHQVNTISGWSFLVPAFRQLTFGAYVYDKYQLNSSVLLHGAVRYDFGGIDMYRYRDWFTSEAEVDGELVSINVVRATDLERTFSNVVWSSGVNYTIGKLDIKANIGKSFRMPIAKELGANGVNYHYFSYERGDATLNPEQSYQADVGVNWTEKKWNLSVSPFFNYFSNYIYLNPTPDHDYFYGAGNQIFQYAQSKVTRYGGEIQAKWNFHRSLSIEVLGEYLYAEQQSGDKKGYTLPFSPPPSVLMNLTWFPKSNDRILDPFFSIDYRVVLPQNNIVPPEKETPGYQVINMQVGGKLQVNGHPLSINLQVQNLLDTKYMNHTSFYRLIGLPEAGRNIILNMNIPFLIKHNKQR
ncbi:MAG TPA: TonB-dependent receptor [Ohtaekwangia sp.]|nr:TonB-dependent receptor [Ohtaekwangia sp.]